MSGPYLRMEGVRKSFPGVQALKGVTFDAHAGEALALVGANGAGKSTLMNVLAGVLVPDEGQILIDGERVVIRSPADAAHYGIAFVHQELALLPTMSIVDNMSIGRFPTGRGVIDYRMAETNCRTALNRLGYDFDPKTLIRDLGPGDQQIVEIARTLLQEPKILIFDEPTSSLTAREKQRLFDIIRIMKDRGVTIIYITHLLDEVFSVCERSIVLRNGETVGGGPIASLSRDRIIEMMIGVEEVGRYFSREKHVPGLPILEVDGLSREGVLADISFSLREGEVIGLWGLLGSGRTELLRALFGLDRIDSGVVKVTVEGRTKTSQEEVRSQMGFVTEDRRTDGLFLPMSARANMSIANLKNILLRWPFINRSLETKLTNEYVDRLAIKVATLDQRVATLSGGNQQKIVVARWLETNPRIFLMDEPTRGLDVEAKAEIHRLTDRLARDGAAIMVVSSDLDEILSVSDRYLVMVRGRVVADLPGSVEKKDLVAAASQSAAH